MTFPNFLYYEETDSARSYQEEATGAMDIERLLQGSHKYWVSPFSSQQKKKKKIVLAFWHTDSWSSGRKKTVRMKLKELIKDGFELFLWQYEAKPYPITLENLWHSSVAVCPDSIWSVEKALGVNHQKICVLDDYWLECLLANEERLEARVISLYDFQNASKGRDDFSKWLSNTTPPVSLIQEDILTDEDLSQEAPYTLLPQAKKTADVPYKKVKLRNMSLLDDGQFINKSSQILELDISLEKSKPLTTTNAEKVMLFLARCAYLRKLIFYPGSDIRIQEFNNAFCEFLMKVGCLQDIRLVFHGVGVNFESLSQGSMMALQKFCLFGAAITPNCLAKLFEAAPDLKRIELWDLKGESNLSSLAPGTFLGLEHLNLGDTQLTHGSLAALLKAAPDLKEIVLNSSTTSLSGISSVQLAKLELMTICRGVTGEELSALLNLAPNLRGISCLCKSIKGKVKLLPNSLMQLKFITVSADSWSRANLIALRNAAPNAKIITTSKVPSPGYLLPRFINDSLPMDASTSDGQSSFNMSRVFYPLEKAPEPKPHLYRLNVYNELELNPKACSESNAFQLKPAVDLSIQTYNVPNIEPPAGQKCYAGYYETELCGKWQALPSLSPWEQLLSLKLNPSTVDYSLVYSSKTNLFYIKHTLPKAKPCIVTLEYVISIPDESQSVPQDVQDLADECRRYEAGRLSLVENSYTGEEYIDLMHQQRKGACRHRAVVFKAKMAKLHPEMEVRIVTNVSHAFVEIKTDKGWICLDLGGYPANLTLNDQYKEALTDDLEKTDPQEEVMALPDPIDEFINQSLMTWERKSEPRELSNYLKDCVCPAADKDKWLIELPSTEALEGMQYQIRSYCHNLKKPVFYIHSPDDLICTSPRMVLGSDGLGVIQQGPTGPLYDFLTTKPDGVIIVNYSNFSSEDLVKFNSLLDAKRKIENILIPSSMVVIGLIDDGVTQKPGSDFYSRFDVVDACPIEPASLTKHLHPKPLEDETTNAQNIDLYCAPDWRSQLLGGFVSTGGQWHYKEGLLKQALSELQKGQSLRIQNGLWDSQEFCHFWQEVQQTGIIHTPEGYIPWPSGLALIRAEGYDWKTLSASVEITPTTGLVYEVVNPATAHKLFGQYALKGHDLEYEVGAIAKAAQTSSKELALYVTHELPKDTWAKLLTKAKAFGVLIKAKCANGVSFPSELNCTQPLKTTNALIPLPTQWPDHGVIATDDIDVTLARCVQQIPECLLINCSELCASDLLSKVDGAVVNQPGHPLHLKFTETIGALKKALSEGQKVVLYGEMSFELSGALASLLIEKTNGLYFVGEHTRVCNFLSENHYQHDVSQEEKLALLQSCLKTTSKPPLYCEERNESFIHLLTKRRWMLRHGSRDGNGAWVGLRDINRLQLDPGVFDPDKKELVAESWSLARKASLNQLLETEPYAFVSGLSGVGKSTFIMDEYCDKDDILYVGESKLLDFAKDKRNKRKILFIDEANLSPNQWTIFEGLYHNPPGLIINGQYHKLDEHHRVIFAGNPLSYGDERQLSPLFARHGNAVLFDVIPSQVLFERVLAPLFKDSALEPQAGALSAPILAVYRFLCLISQKDILISPRELEMMALCIITYCQQHPEESPLVVAKHMAFHLAHTLVPKEHQANFLSQCQPTETLKPPSIAFNTEAYLLTPSRQNTVEWLNHFLSVREARKQATNSKQRYGGLGGVVIEGEPGIGKSDMVSAFLIAKGYHELHDNKAPITDGKGFYRMPVGMPLTQKEALLRKAFNEGAVVLVDEINSSPMMERLLNALLMGTTPEGSRPKIPGFLIIGTQNPPIMAGRRSMSTALLRRMMKLNLPPYNTEEMCDILKAKGLNAILAEKLINAYEKKRQEALDKKLQPIPSFRDVLRIAKRIVHTRTRKTSVTASFEPLLEMLKNNQARLEAQYSNHASLGILKVSKQLIKGLGLAHETFKNDGDVKLFYNACLHSINEAKSKFNTQRSSWFLGFLNTLWQKIRAIFRPDTAKQEFFQTHVTTKSADILYVFNEGITTLLDERPIRAC